MENRLAARRSFSRAILHHKALSKEKEDLLVVFMLSNIQEVFKVGECLQNVYVTPVLSLHINLNLSFKTWAP